MTSAAEIPDTKIGIASVMPNHVKVQLRYLTKEAKHLRSFLLSGYTGIGAPYMEEVCILMPYMRVFPVIECFLPPFETLKQEGVVPEDAELQSYRILDHDELTLAYILR